MADTTTLNNMDSENAAFWLPKHFLTDDDFLSPPDNYNNNNNNNNVSSGFGFGFDSSDNDDHNFIQDDDVSLVSHLTRHLARSSLHDSPTTTTKNSTTSEMPWLFSTSPQSTLSGFGGGWSSANRSGFSSNGSPSGPSSVPSPPLTPELQNDAAWDLLYEAAGQVARLKMTAIAAQLNANAALLTAPRHSCGFTPSYNNKQCRDLEWAHNCNGNNHHQNHQQRRSCGGISQTAWPPLGTRQLHNRGAQMRGVYQGVGATRPVGGPTLGVKRPSAGTGVFLPRRVSNSPPRHHHSQHTEFRRKPSVMVPASVNMEVEEPNLKSNMRFGGGGFPTDHDLMMGRRNVIMGQQRRNLIGRSENNAAAAAAAMMVGHGHEIRLPTDWTY